MIRQAISRSHSFASLSTQSQVLFCMMIPHFNGHGKMNGEPHYIKGEVCPLVAWATVETIAKCLEEISDKTKMKWFEKNGLKYLHALDWNEHQDIRTDRLGDDFLPGYIPETPGSIRREVEVEVEVEEEDELKPKPPRARVVKVTRADAQALENPDFRAFWAAYPNKKARFRALKVWEHLKPDLPTQKTILLALERFKRTSGWTKDGGQFIPHPATWLNQRRWEDEIKEDELNGAQNSGRSSQSGAQRIVGEAGYRPGKYADLEDLSKL